MSELKKISEIASEYDLSVQAIYKRIKNIIADQESDDGLKSRFKRFKPIKPHVIKDERGQTVLDKDGQEILEEILSTSGLKPFKRVKPEVLNVLNHLNQSDVSSYNYNMSSIDEMRQILHDEFFNEVRGIVDDSDNTKDELIKELKQTINMLNERLHKMDEQLDIKDQQIKSLNQLVSQAQTITQTTQIRELIPASEERTGFFDRLKFWKKQ